MRELAMWCGVGLEGGRACFEAALEYLALGWSPLALCPPDHHGMSANHKARCEQPGKVPWHKWKDLQDRAPLELEVRKWWRDQPRSNVGLSYGTVLAGADSDGDGGEAQLRDRSQGDLPRTLEFTTPGGGRRLLYALPPGVVLRTTTHKAGLHQELRIQGHGAQTVMPPSRHANGGVYAWVRGHGPRDLNPAPAPLWILNELKPIQPRVVPKVAVPSPRLNGVSQDAVVRRAIAYLARIPASVSGQGGHNAAMRAARTVVYGFALGKDVGFDILAAHWNSRCVPPWSDGELRHKCDQADRVEFGKPRGYMLLEEKR